MRSVGQPRTFRAVTFQSSADNLCFAIVPPVAICETAADTIGGMNHYLYLTQREIVHIASSRAADLHNRANLNEARAVGRARAPRPPSVAATGYTRDTANLMLALVELLGRSSTDSK